MITKLSRFPKHLLEGFSGEYLRPDGQSVSFTVCLNQHTSVGKAALDTRRQTLIEGKSRAGGDISPQVYSMGAGLSAADLSAGIKHALHSGDASVPVFIELPNKESFANTCEALGMSRRSLLELAGATFIVNADTSKQAHGGFHRILGQAYDQKHLPITLYEDTFGPNLQLIDPQAFDYAMGMTDDLKRVLPGAQKYVLHYKNQVSLKHLDGELGRYFAPQDVTAIEAKVHLGEGTEVAYTFVLFPSQFGQNARDFDVAVLMETDKQFSIFPVMMTVRPNEKLNNVDVDYRPFASESTINHVNSAGDNFSNACDHMMFVMMASLEWVNSPNAARVDHQPKQKQTTQSLAAQFAAGGKRPFFSTVEIRIPDPSNDMLPLHKEGGAESPVRGITGLQSVTAHWQRYGANKEWKFRRTFERGSAVHGVSAHIGIGGQEPE